MTSAKMEYPEEDPLMACPKESLVMACPEEDMVTDVEKM
jgi:hypothetical protein